MISKRVIKDLAQTAPYLVRWSIWLPFGWTLKVHQILRPDDDRCSHDHPWWFFRVILWGGYVEVHGDNRVAHRKPWRPWAPWRVYFCRPSFRHRIIELPRGQSWTLALCGGHRGVWGFFTRDGWMHWREFVDAAWAKRVLWCDDDRSIEVDVKQ